VHDAFYRLDGERYLPTELTRGPWDPESQHAGCPAALLGREIELFRDRDDGGLEQVAGGATPAALGPDFQVGRITFEILRPVPIEPLTASAQLVRPGRRVALCEATLASEENEVMRAKAWLIRRGGIDLPPSEEETEAVPPGPDRGESSRPPGFEEVGYHGAIDYSFVFGSWTDPGPATAWLRMRCPLVEGEEPSPLVRVLVAADTGNGISWMLDWNRFLFINVDLSVHLHRLPAGEWVCLESRTLAEPNGVGLADTRLYDERGPIGRAAQTLLVAERS
jgi:hypothetical protein